MPMTTEPIQTYTLSFVAEKEYLKCPFISLLYMSYMWTLSMQAGLSPGSAHKGTSVFDLIYEAYEAAQEYLKKFELPRSQQDADSPR